MGEGWFNSDYHDFYEIPDDVDPIDWEWKNREETGKPKFKIVFDKSFADYHPTSLKNWFKPNKKNILKITKVEGIENLNTSEVTDMSNMFDGCSSLKSIDISSFDLSKVTNMYEMFNGCSSLESVNLPNFNAPNLESMWDMFQGCSSLKSVNLQNANIPKVSNIMGMFSGCSSLTSIDLSFLSKSRISGLVGLFRGCSSLTSIDMSPIKFSTSLNNVSDMFQGCSSLKNLDLSIFNGTQIKYFSDMFNGCSSLTSLDLSPLANSSKPERMAGMFQDCSSLKNLDLSKFNTSLVENMSRMFQGCTGFTELELSNFSTASLTSTDGMFKDCSNLAKIYTAPDFYTDKVTESDDMFAGCTKLKGDKPFNANYVDKTYAKALGGYFLSHIRPWAAFADGTLTFQYGNKEEVGTNEYFMNFDDGSTPGWLSPSVKKVVFDKSFADARPEYCCNWFNGCKNLESIEGLDNLNTSRAKSMEQMFRDCHALTSLALPKLDVRKVTNFSGMFYNCRALKNLDLTWLNTSGATNMSGMFADCPSLTMIYASNNFVVDNVTSSTDMFRGCTSLKGDKAFDANYTDKTYAKTTQGYLSAKTNVHPWVKIADGTLTFMYGSKPKVEEGDGEYYIGNYLIGTPGWLKSISSINKVVFDNSFIYYNPISCYQWFNGAKQLTSIDGLENLNTSEIRNMAYMFSGCSALASIDWAKLNEVQNVTDMKSMFDGCSSLTAIDISKLKESFPKVTNTSYMFRGCSALTSLDFKGVSTSPEYMYNMFDGCSSLTSLDLTGFDTQKIGAMSDLFRGCSQLTELDLTSFSPAKLEYTTRMFSGCEKLRNIFVNDKFATKDPSSSKSQNMFEGCVSLPGFDASATDGSKARYKSRGGYFYSLSDYILRPWAQLADGTLTLRYSRMTDLRKEYNELALNNSSDTEPEWYSTAANIKKVVIDPSFSEARPTTGYKLFANCTNLTDIEGIENLNTSEMTDMTDMFSNCFKLKYLDLSSFNTSKVTSMKNMFLQCTGLNSVDLSNFNTENVTDMNLMFYCCKKLTFLNLTSFNTKNVESMQQIFFDLESIKYIHISDKFVANKLKNVYKAFDYSGDAVLVCQLSEYEALKTHKLARWIRPCVSINAKSPFGTLCVPFGSQLTKDSYTGFDKLYRVKSANADEGTITFEEATEIEPGASYVYRRNLAEGDESIITFTVDNTKASVTAPQNGSSLMKGTFERIIAPEGSYLLQSDGNFHPVPAGNTTIGVGANRAYLDLSTIEASGAKTYRMVFEEKGTSSMKGVSDEADEQPKVYFDLMGRRIAVPQKGKVYIVRGKKVVF